ncbi:tripartite tricarboxylate transporter substrate binding protein [Bordetella petrii]|nr:tripartite tricarboxylate transporter substrate binding protein [Bordetella petrii]
MKVLLSILSMLCFLVAPMRGYAASYPDHAVKIVVPFSPGGPTDLLARTLAKYLQSEMGQPFVVENKAGAANIIGSAYVAKSAPDGYTLLLVANSHAILPSTIANLPFDPLKDFEAVAMIGTAPYVLVARPDLGIKTVKDLAQLAKQRGKPMFYGTPGTGTANHLAVQMLADHFGIRFQQVSYKGAAPATQALLAGQVDFIVNNVTSSIPFIQSGELIAAGLTGKGAEDLLPGVPLIGDTIPGFEALAWYGILAPANTPANILNDLAKAMTHVGEKQDFRDAIMRLGVQPRLMIGDEFEGFISSEIDKWAGLAERAGVKPE